MVPHTNSAHMSKALSLAHAWQCVEEICDSVLNVICIPASACRQSEILLLCIQVLDELPSTLLALVLAAAPRSLLSLQAVIPQHLHMEALHAVHPAMTSDGRLEIVHQDSGADEQDLIWCLLPRTYIMRLPCIILCDCLAFYLQLQCLYDTVESMCAYLMASCCAGIIQLGR